jgi:ATP-dependent helicase/nuclease subunit B
MHAPNDTQSVSAGNANMFTDLYHDLEAGATVITVNHRLARTLHTRYNRHKANQGFEVWPRPDILSMEAWTQRCWDQLIDRPPASGEAPFLVLLSLQQEKALWEQIIEASPEASQLLRLSAAARAAMEAWEMLQAWRIRLENYRDIFNEDATAFYNWTRDFRKKCKAEGWLERASLSDRLAVEITAGTLSLPASGPTGRPVP